MVSFNLFSEDMLFQDFPHFDEMNVITYGGIHCNVDTDEVNFILVWKET